MRPHLASAVSLWNNEQTKFIILKISLVTLTGSNAHHTTLPCSIQAFSPPINHIITTIQSSIVVYEVANTSIGVRIPKILTISLFQGVAMGRVNLPAWKQYGVHRDAGIPPFAADTKLPTHEIIIFIYLSRCYEPMNAMKMFFEQFGSILLL